MMLGRNALGITSPTRPVYKKTVATKTAQLEEKLDGLVQALEISYSFHTNSHGECQHIRHVVTLDLSLIHFVL